MKQLYAMIGLSILMLGCGDSTAKSPVGDNEAKKPEVVGTDADGTLVVLSLPGMT